MALRLVVISDTHGWHKSLDLPEGDVLIHCGDALNTGSVKELAPFLEWFSDQKFTHKIYLPGNHDRCLENVAWRSMFDGIATLLCDSGITIEGIKFYGMPWMPEFFNWAFMLPRNGNRLQARIDVIPNNTDVLITHGPPHGVLDRNKIGENCGCELLLKKVEQVKPTYHLFGHLHPGFGMLDHGNSTCEETCFINASICDDNHKPVNKPVVLKIMSPTEITLDK